MLQKWITARRDIDDVVSRTATRYATVGFIFVGMMGFMVAKAEDSAKSRNFATNISFFVIGCYGYPYCGYHT